MMKKFLKWILILNIVLFAGCGLVNYRQVTKRERVMESIADSYVERIGEIGESASASADATSPDEKYRETLALADDDHDYKWANDYENYYFGINLCDSKNYEEVFGFSKPTEEDLMAAISANKKMDAKYKDFLKDLVHDWLEKYPDSDFSVFLYNLPTLQIKECTASQIQIKAASIGTVACYVSSENTIYVRNDIDISERSSDDYIVLAHETMHAARTTSHTEKGEPTIRCKFFKLVEMGLYEDEAIETYYVYELQGMGNRSKYYTLQSNIYRQFLPYMDYDGSDYMNHSLNYFIQQLDLYLDEIGVETEAYHLVNLVDAQAKVHYGSSSTEPEFDDFSELYEAMSKAYQYEHGYEMMTEEEKAAAFEDFWEDVSFNLENLSKPYTEIEKWRFEKYW